MDCFPNLSFICAMVLFRLGRHCNKYIFLKCGFWKNLDETSLVRVVVVTASLSKVGTSGSQASLK